MKRSNLLAIFIILLIIVVLILPKEVKEIGFESEIVVEGLDTPWAIDFLPDGTMIFTERPGRVSTFDGKEKKLIAQVAVTEISEAGLLGIAVDPEFEDNKFIYLYYTYSSGTSTKNRVSRFIFDNTLKEEKVILDNIPSARFHDGGRIKFGPDGMLYITTGDATDPPSSQDKNSVAGKILRMNKDGSVPQDNPFNNYIYSLGHRNPQGLAWGPDGTLYSSEHGPRRNDELNIIIKGENYGWPQECNEGGRAPLRCFSEFTLAPASLAFYQGDLYVTGLRGGQLRRIILDGKTILDEEELFDNLGRLREVTAHNGYLYITTSNRDGRGVPAIGDDKIIRIKKS